MLDSHEMISSSKTNIEGETDEEARKRELDALEEFMKKKEAQRQSDLKAYKALEEKLGINK